MAKSALELPAIGRPEWGSEPNAMDMEAALRAYLAQLAEDFEAYRLAGAAETADAETQETETIESDSAVLEDAPLDAADADVVLPSLNGSGAADPIVTDFLFGLWMVSPIGGLRDSEPGGAAFAGWEKMGLDKGDFGDFLGGTIDSMGGIDGLFDLGGWSEIDGLAAFDLLLDKLFDDLTGYTSDFGG